MISDSNNPFHGHRHVEICFSQMSYQNSTLPYNFLIGGDGETYEVRGWSVPSGFSFVPHNSSLAIGILGNITSQFTAIYTISAP